MFPTKTILEVHISINFRQKCELEYLKDQIIATFTLYLYDDMTVTMATGRALIISNMKKNCKLQVFKLPCV